MYEPSRVFSNRKVKNKNIKFKRMRSKNKLQKLPTKINFKVKNKN